MIGHMKRYHKVRRYKKMTNLGDVIRQLETTLCDPLFPPTPEEQERMGRILSMVYTGTVDFIGSK
jgi:hypothetical protein